MMVQNLGRWDQATTAVNNMSRRSFLRFSSIAAGLVAAGAMSALPTTALAKVPEGISHMTADEYAIWHRLMRALLQTDGSKLVDPETLPVLQTVDGAFLATLPSDVLTNLKGGVAFFNTAPKDVFGRPFVELNDEEATQFCDALAQSDDVQARALFTALKFLTVTAYWAIPTTWEPIGFQGPVTEKWKLKYLGNQPLPTS